MILPALACASPDCGARPNPSNPRHPLGSQGIHGHMTLLQPSECLDRQPLRTPVKAQIGLIIKCDKVIPRPLATGFHGLT